MACFRLQVLIFWDVLSWEFWFFLVVGYCGNWRNGFRNQPLRHVGNGMDRGTFNALLPHAPPPARDAPPCPPGCSRCGGMPYGARAGGSRRWGQLRSEANYSGASEIISQLAFVISPFLPKRSHGILTLHSFLSIDDSSFSNSTST